MAKGNLLLGTARGRVGDIVLSRRNGKQVIGAKSNPANPKSEAQCRQRMVFASLTSSAARLRTIIDHSFEGVKVGQTSVNHFVKLNTPLLRAGINYNGEELPEGVYNDYLVKGAKGIARMPFKVSEGSLYFPQGTLVSGGYRISGLDSGSDIIQDTLIGNPADYISVLSALGVKPGEQLSMVVVATTGDIVGSYDPTGAENYNSIVEYARVIFKDVEDIDFDVITPAALINTGEGPEMGRLNSDFINFERSSAWADEVRILVDADNSTLTFVPVINNASFDVKMATVIRSARGESKWLRSTQFMAVVDDQNATADMVWPSYGNQTTEAQSNLYLNQATNSSSVRDVFANAKILGFQTSFDGNDVTISEVVTSGMPTSGTLPFVVRSISDGLIAIVREGRINANSINDWETNFALTDDQLNGQLELQIFGATFRKQL